MRGLTDSLSETPSKIPLQLVWLGSERWYEGTDLKKSLALATEKLAIVQRPKSVLGPSDGRSEALEVAVVYMKAAP